MLSDNDIDEIVDWQMDKLNEPITHWVRPMFEVMNIDGTVDDGHVRSDRR